ncbi:2-hydroxy-3-keto-5-methylthiopentenyl-1-phosphate phosphatase [Peribacillus deserti]|uniref:2-hydroxy-3-keto-5-methylthiopentenyl-1-phosphate phosphatase n=1 Tax=Peribacillus deserti TaxID=673318 RepID=A0A2N5M3M4_9BACI|nr:2-hydroxy-3-keto-5-methylthiopentenyl-1-phosphate phosphatase [Peribacillus deserti]PLT28966.1 2-hydroxy-3-keto-5-methylthiopentenyl-1-phosphate phosphatase [Peribacillus deserti]
MKPIIFCDFDGTITDSDNIIALMKAYGPQGWDRLKEQVLQKEISISEGVGKMFSLLESGLKQDIIDFVVREAKIRPGFKEFVDFTKEQQIPFYVVSGGIDFFVEPMLKKYVSMESVYCNHGNFNGEFIQIEWPHSCDEHCENGCGCCKPSIMRKLADDSNFQIVIGDSITDLEAAKKADLVLARDFLIEKCKEEGIPYQPFTTFYDCINILKKELGVMV